jgi:xanthine dehydrogenase accessory factor
MVRIRSLIVEVVEADRSFFRYGIRRLTVNAFSSLPNLAAQSPRYAIIIFTASTPIYVQAQLKGTKMHGIWKTAAIEIESDNDFVVATIIKAEGSSPRHIGTRFLVRQDGSFWGTIGGGLFESRVLTSSFQAIKARQSRRHLFSFTGEDATSEEMICGGDVEVLIEFVDSSNQTHREIFSALSVIEKKRKSALFFTFLPMIEGREFTGPLPHMITDGEGAPVGNIPDAGIILDKMPPQRLLKPTQMLELRSERRTVLVDWLRPTGDVYIFGAGHVGAALAHLAAYVNFRVIVLDDRDEFASVEKLTDADRVVVLDSYDDALSQFNFDEDSYLVIVTRGHLHDKTVLEQALKTRAGYIGMIGSRRKIALIYQNLLSDGFSSGDLERVHAPIGLDIGGETPEEIAVSIIAQLIERRDKKTGSKI